MTALQFTKMHGLGNDFMVINTLTQPIDVDHLPISQLANRNCGVGFDQLLLIESSQQADFYCRIFNRDGSEAEQCGNGLRCIARFIHETGLYHHPHFQLETKAGFFPVTIEDYDHIRLELPPPLIQASEIDLPLDDHRAVAVSILSLGNPHAITKVDSIDHTLIDQFASTISRHTAFPQGVNVGFVQVLNREHIRLRTVERGAGETLACGSNACAAVCAGINNHWLDQKVKVESRGGCLWIEWQGNQTPIYMTGPATKVFVGRIDI